ncbi:MAG: hypothetical protein EOO92_20640 [Pedobacter sp.]|nr:MAG: hypothetical protein EOO92_20640 [Pedobacter sp.]
MKSKLRSLATVICALIFSNVSAQNLNIEGTWRLVSQKTYNADGSYVSRDSTNVYQIKVYTPTTFVNVTEMKVPDEDNQLLVRSFAGGKYAINGDTYEEFTEFASWKNPRGLKVNMKINQENGKLHMVGMVEGTDGWKAKFDEWYSKVDVPEQSKELTGTWKMVSQRVDNPDGSVFNADSTNRTMHKMFTNGMVVVYREQVVPQADNQKLVVSVGGGRYTLKDGVYAELISFASYKGFEKMQSKFNLTIEGNKLHTVGSFTEPNGIVATYDEWFEKVN